MTVFSIIGCGFVADLYMRSFAVHDEVSVALAYDQNPDRLAAFGKHWNVKTASDLKAFLADLPKQSIVLNLTNPSAHFEINSAILNAGHHVYCEKPLALNMPDAVALCELAKEQNLRVAAAPCSVLGEAAQTLIHATNSGTAGKPRLIYADLDDGFIPQAPFKDWISESGAPWPAKDEFRVGCTLEHAGYYLSWLIAMNGAVTRVVAASGNVVADLLPNDAGPDFSTATLFFENGVVARLTCSITAPHDHRIRVIGDDGVLVVKQAWNNAATVRFHRRMRIRRRLLENPVGRKIKATRKTHPKVGRWGAAAMNFGLGPIEMASAIAEDRPCRIGSDFSLHLTEVALAIHNAGDKDGVRTMKTRCTPMQPMPWFDKATEGGN